MPGYINSFSLHSQKCPDLYKFCGRLVYKLSPVAPAIEGIVRTHEALPSTLPGQLTARTLTGLGRGHGGAEQQVLT